MTELAPGPVTTSVDDGVATIVMDDGKANALSPTMQAFVNSALDTALTDDEVTAIVLAGRPGLLSGGFDLKVIAAGGADARGMLRGGFELAHRLLSSPKPVVMACTGHAIAMGSFLVMSGDYAVGAEGPYRILANEVAIGMTMPLSAVAIMRHRLTPAALQRAAVLSEPFDPQSAVVAGFLDRIVPPDSVITVAQEFARSTAALDRAAHLATKLRIRQATLEAILEGIDADFG